MEEEVIQYDIDFYSDKRGKVPTAWQLLTELARSQDKQSKSLYNAITFKLGILRKIGTRDGMPNFRAIKGSRHKLWEVRVKHASGNNRIFFCAWNGKSFVLLNYFIKQKRPQKSKLL